MKKCVIFICSLIISMQFPALSQRVFIHPGGLHSLADLERMKENVNTQQQPWLAGWNELIKDPWAQNSYTASPLKNMGVSRQKASIDAHAAYLNTIRWYISGDESYARCAIDICNAWASAVDQIPSGNEISGLGGIPTSEFALAAEILRLSPLWKKKDFERFQSMMVNYLYPLCRDFLLYHNGRNVDYYWANWDICNVLALVAIGVLCDDEKIYDEGINYFKNGKGNGNIRNVIPYIHFNNTDTGLGQWQESGRDQEHAQLGVGLMANICQVAWNQGDDLFAYDNNRLLAGAEYVAQHNLMKNVPYTYYNNSQELNNRWPSINGLGQLRNRPVWEMIYNHYEVLKGIPAPNSKQMAEVLRPEHGSKDHFGYGTLTYTLKPSAFPPLQVPAVPQHLTARGSIDKVFLKWEPSEGYTACGYSIQRSLADQDDFVELTSYIENTINEYTDLDVKSNTKYKYRVAAINKTGKSNYSEVVTATPAGGGSLPDEWSFQEMEPNQNAVAMYATVNSGSFVIKGHENAIGNESGFEAYVYKKVEGDCELTCRIHRMEREVDHAGLIIRESLEENDKSVSLTLGYWGKRFARMGIRAEKGGEEEFKMGNTYTWVPAWFKLKRFGDMLYAYESPDGINWFYIDSVQTTLSRKSYVGIVASSGNKTNQNKAEFDNVSVVTF